MFITENGSAWPDEVSPRRPGARPRAGRLPVRHLAAVADAIDAGTDVRGYFAWRLLDNYEWAHGYDQRFGLVHVDYDTQVRTAKDSAHVYAEALRQHPDGR